MKAMLENWSTYDLELEVSIMHFCVYFSVYFNIVCDVWWRDILHWFIGHKMGLEILWMSSDNKNISNFKICNRNGDWNVILNSMFFFLSFHIEFIRNSWNTCYHWTLQNNNATQT